MNFTKLVNALLDRGFSLGRAKEVANWWCFTPPGTPYPELSNEVFLNKASWDESKHKRDNDGRFSSTGGGTLHRSTKEIRTQISRLERARKRPNYAEGLTDEDRRAIQKLDDQILSDLRAEYDLTKRFEDNERIARHNEEISRRKALSEANHQSQKNEEYEHAAMQASVSDKYTEDLVEDLDDDETPYRTRQAIKKELKKRGVNEDSYDYYRWTDTGCEAREKRIDSLQREFDHMQTEQQRWQQLSVSHKDSNMRKKYARRAKLADSELDMIEKELDELKRVRDSGVSSPNL